MENENMAYRFRVTDIVWDVADEIEEGETYDDVAKRRNLPSETEVEFVHTANPTNEEIVDAIGEVLCDMYHFCAVVFCKELVEKGEEPLYDAEKENESKAGWVLIIRQDCGNTFVHLFRSKENAIKYVKKDIARKANYYTYAEEDGNANEQAEAEKVLTNEECWEDWGGTTYTLYKATYEDDGNNREA